MLQLFDKLQETTIAAAVALNRRLGVKDPVSQRNLSTLGVLVAAFVCAFLPLDLSQLVFAVAGAAGYAMLQAMQPKQKTPVPQRRVPSNTVPAPRQRAMQQADRQAPRNRMPPRPAYRERPTGPAPVAEELRTVQSCVQRTEVFQPSAMPISAPIFRSRGWDAEVEELLGQIAPTPKSDKVVQQLAKCMEQALWPVIPEVEVVGFASGNLARGKAFGVAVPEVDVVASVSPAALAKRLQRRAAQSGGALASVPPMQLDEWKLQKSAIRTCTDRLVASGFKFRRSAFRGQEPKVTLLAPASLGIFDEAIPVDFSVNSVTPLYTAALLTECGQIEPRAKSLILLVKRWAKDRGICHAAKGHLPPYAWSLFAIYFLQVGTAEGGLLPPLEDFAGSASLMTSNGGTKTDDTPRAKAPTAELTQPKAETSAGAKLSVGNLFKAFVHFYHTEFNWRKEAVSVRSGKRGLPNMQLPLHIMEADGRDTEVAPSIEDPFEAGRNLGAGMNISSLRRLKEELARAQALFDRNASLSELLEPWVPEDQTVPDASPTKGGAEDSGDESTRAPSQRSATPTRSSSPTLTTKSTNRASSPRPRERPEARGAVVPPWRVQRGKSSAASTA